MVAVGCGCLELCRCEQYTESKLARSFKLRISTGLRESSCDADGIVPSSAAREKLNEIDNIVG